MKKSNIILLALVLVLCGTFVSLAVALRVKIDRHDYQLAGNTTDAYETMSVGVFSVIQADNLYSVDVRQGDRDEISLPSRKEDRPAYKVVGDTLTLAPHDVPGRDRIRVTVRDLKAFYASNMQSCQLTGLKGDSLSIQTDGQGNLDIDSLSYGSLQLRSPGGLTLSNSTCRTLWLNLDSTAQLNLQQDKLEAIRGRWSAQAGLQLDGSTLAAGIQKIEHIQ